jgi:hypothetical protein
MNGILRLYPRAWRQRYLAEVADLLVERPPTGRDRLDLVLGAIDAWLHPQVSSPAPDPTGEPLVRPGGVVALGVAAGLIWVVGGVSQHAATLDPMTGYKFSTGTMLVIAAPLLSAFAALARAWSTVRPTRGLRSSALGMLGFALLVLAPRPLLVIGFWGHLLMTALFGYRLYEARERLGLVLVLAAIVAATFNTESEFALATIPIGLAWMAAGVLVARRRTVAVSAA